MDVHHVGIAVENLEAAAQPYFSLGYSLEAEERVEGQGVQVWMLAQKGSGTRIELLQSVRENSAVAKFIAKRGPGLHHLALATADIQAELQRLLAEGAPLIDPVPRPGFGGHLVAFIHPKWAGGVLLELVQTRS
ncbi:MAG: methylmalonyl-CoA epimerase [Thermaceae bacterium]|nr:methylmalonyl-CoA epimerase [Thermaceae bacterium]